MTTITIPKNLMSKSNLIAVPYEEYKRFLASSLEELDTDEAINVYKKEKRQGKLKILKSLANLR